jgi:hypothetical protein
VGSDGIGRLSTDNWVASMAQARMTCHPRLIMSGTCVIVVINTDLRHTKARWRLLCY